MIPRVDLRLELALLELPGLANVMVGGGDSKGFA